MSEQINLDEARHFLRRHARRRPRQQSYVENMFAGLFSESADEPADESSRRLEAANAGPGVRLTQAVTLLRVAREEQGLSLEELHLDTGISRGRLSRIENRVEVNPTIGTLDRIAEALGLRLLVTVAAAPETNAEESPADTQKTAVNVAL